MAHTTNAKINKAESQLPRSSQSSECKRYSKECHAGVIVIFKLHVSVRLTMCCSEK